MSGGVGLRFFLLEEDGTLRRLSRRLVDGLVRGEDRLPRYAGERLRVATVWLRLEGDDPVEADRIEGEWWEFDATGGIRDSLTEALREALDVVHGPPPRASHPPGPVVQLAPHLRRRRAAGRWRWTPTSAEVTRIVHAIWPETAGRPVARPEAIAGVARRRHPVSRSAEHAYDGCREHVWKIQAIVERLVENDLEGLLEAIRERSDPEGRGEGRLWRGLGQLVEHELAVRKARRSRGGPWVASVEVIRRTGRDTWEGKVVEHRMCRGRNAAVAASRELLRKHAGLLDHDARVEAQVCPEIEWEAPEASNSDEADEHTS